MIPVKGYSGLYRDEFNNAIINKNQNSYEEYLKTKNRLIEKQKKIEGLENEIFEIKQLLKTLIENK